MCVCTSCILPCPAPSQVSYALGHEDGSSGSPLFRHILRFVNCRHSHNHSMQHELSGWGVSLHACTGLHCAMLRGLHVLMWMQAHGCVDTWLIRTLCKESFYWMSISVKNYVSVLSAHLAAQRCGSNSSQLHACNQDTWHAYGGWQLDCPPHVPPS